MSRQLIFLVAALLLLFGGLTSSLAETLAGTAKSESQTHILTLNEAVYLASQNNIDLRKAAIDYNMALVDAEHARINARGIDADSVDSLQKAQTKYLSTKQKQLAEDVAKQTYDIAKEQTANTAEKAYYDLLKGVNILKVREISVQRAQEQLNLVQRKYKTGTAVRTDLHKAELGLAGAKSDLANAQRDLKNYQVTLNKCIGLDIDEAVRPSIVLKYEKVSLPDVNNLTQTALETRIDLKKARNTVETSKIAYDLIVSWLSPGTYSGKKSKGDLDKAELDLIQTEQNVRADIISTLFQAQKADEVVQLMSKSLEQAKESHNLAKRRYEIGAGTYVDLLGASVDLADAESKYIEAVYNHILAKSQLKTVTLVSR